MLIVLVLALAAQASLPPAETSFQAETRYVGPGLLCGAAFAVSLREGESATRLKSTAVDERLNIRIQEGEFTVEESQHATRSETKPVSIGEGMMSRQMNEGRSLWVYRDGAPGSTDIYGPAVDAPYPTPALLRMIFRSPRYQALDGNPCLSGERR